LIDNIQEELPRYGYRCDVINIPAKGMLPDAEKGKSLAKECRPNGQKKAET
jgi:hypothetical protein